MGRELLRVVFAGDDAREDSWDDEAETGHDEGREELVEEADVLPEVRVTVLDLLHTKAPPPPTHESRAKCRSSPLG